MIADLDTLLTALYVELTDRIIPRLLRQSEYNERLKNLAPLMEAALRWPAARPRPRNCCA